METIYEKTDKNEIDKELIAAVGSLIKSGGIVAFPTETVYGLGANALDEKAAVKIYEAKGRPSDNPLIIHISKLEDLAAIVSEVPEKAMSLAKKYWPGPLTMIFPKSDLVPYETTGGLETVAVRMPKHPVGAALIEAGGGYIAAPSANASGKPSPTTAAHVAEDMDGRIDMVIDGGAVGIGIESTIIDMSVPVPAILRPGYITREMIEACIGAVQMAPEISGETREGPKAPGMKYKHYAPKAPLVIVEGDIEKAVAKINELAEQRFLQGKKIGIIATDETMHKYKGGCIKSIGVREQGETIAHNLYSVLRAFDREQVDYIYAEAFYQTEMGQAIMNRLQKAAGNQIIHV